MLAFGEYEEDGTASTVKARDFKDATDLIYGPAVASPLTSSRQSTDDGSRTYVPEVAAPLRAGGPESGWQNDLDNGTFIPFDTTQITNPNNRSNPKSGDPCHSLAADAHPPCIAFPEYMSGTQAVRLESEDVSLTLGATNPMAVAFKPSHFTRDKDGAPSEIAPPLTADTDKGDQDTVLLAFTSKDGGQDAAEQLAPTLRSMNHQNSHANGGGQVAIAFQERGREGGRNLEHQEDVAYALTSPDAGGRRNEINVATGWAVRRLTPVECERLQNVPDCFTHITMKKRQRTLIPADLEAYWLSQRPDLTKDEMRHLCTDSPRYRVLGNSFSRNVPRWIGHGIKIVDQILRERGE
jgi:hypothetical protein